jgi:hypothetical protein
VEEGEALVVGGVPGVVVGAEAEALLVVRGVSEQSAALAGVDADLVPQDVPDPGGMRAQEDAG